MDRGDFAGHAADKAGRGKPLPGYPGGSRPGKAARCCGDRSHADEVGISLGRRYGTVGGIECDGLEQAVAAEAIARHTIGDAGIRME